MVLYLALCFIDFFKLLLKDLLKDIFISLVFAVLVLFFGRVVFEDSSSFLSYWKWSYIAVLCIGTIQYLNKVWNTWPLIKELSLRWGLSPKEVYTGLIRSGLAKRHSPEEIFSWGRESFIFRRNMHQMVKKLFD